MAFYNLTEKYSTIPNSILTDENLSFVVKGLWTYLNSKPDGWEFSAKRISLETKESKETIYKYLGILSNLGYLDREKLPSGKMDYYLTDGNPTCKDAKLSKNQVGKCTSLSNTYKDKKTKAKKNGISQKPDGFFDADSTTNKLTSSPNCLEIINYLSDKKKIPLSKPESHIRVLQTLMLQIKDEDPKDLILDVIDFKVEEWLGTQFERHISPKTIFKPTNFWDYVDQMNSDDASQAPKEDEIEWAKKQLEKGEWT